MGGQAVRAALRFVRVVDRLRRLRPIGLLDELMRFSIERRLANPRRLRDRAPGCANRPRDRDVRPHARLMGDTNRNSAFSSQCLARRASPRQTRPRQRNRFLGEGPQRPPPQSKLAIHIRKRPHQAQKPLPINLSESRQQALELDAVRAALGHGLPSFESPTPRSIFTRLLSGPMSPLQSGVKVRL
jgi:hypothetical protein